MSTTTYGLNWREVHKQALHKKSLALPRLRLLGVAGFLGALFILLFMRLTTVMLIPSQDEDHAKGVMAPLSTTRAKIVDRHGEILAVNLGTGSIYANPKDLIDIDETISELVKLFPDLNAKTLKQKLQSQKSFVWIKRNLTPKQQQSIYSVGLPGIYFQREEKRFYPHGPVASHVVGHTNIDLEGTSGLERQYNDSLHTKDETLELSLDIRVQNVLREELQKGIEHFQAKGGSGIVMDVNTGEIIAMVSLPDFDPHNPGSAPEVNRFNASTLGAYEMGSVFKMFTIAMGLDSGKIKLTDSFDATHPFKLGRFTITDVSPKRRWLTVPEIFMYSSNIGTIKIMQAIGKEEQIKFFEKIGLLSSVPVAYPELAVPFKPKEWREANAITASYGYGIAVTPLHLAVAVSALVNGGILRQPTFLKQRPGADVTGKRVISSRTSEHMRRLLHLIAKQGTGKKADVKGYLVGVKTGSANKKIKGGYNKKDHLATAVAAFPMTSPRYLVQVTLDTPRPAKETYGFATAGWTAAPVAHEIIKNSGSLLGVPPVDEDDIHIQEAMHIKVSQNENARTIG